MKQQLYVMVKDALKKDIISHKYEVGDKLPSENELCALFDVGKSTIRQALNILVNEGYVYSVNRTGYFVNEAKNDEYEFSFDELKIRGEVCEDIRVIYANMVDKAEAGRFADKAQGSKRAIKVGRIFSYLGIPSCYEEKFLFYTKSFKMKDSDLFGGNSADLLNEYIMNYSVKRSLRFRVVKASSMSENYLRVDPDSAVLLAEQTYLDSYGRPLGVCRNYYRSDVIEISASTAKN